MKVLDLIIADHGNNALVDCHRGELFVPLVLPEGHTTIDDSDDEDEPDDDEEGADGGDVGGGGADHGENGGDE